MDHPVQVGSIILIGEVTVSLVGRQTEVEGGIDVMIAESVLIPGCDASLFPVLHAARSITAGSKSGILVGGSGGAAVPAGIITGLGIGTDGIAVQRDGFFQV